MAHDNGESNGFSIGAEFDRGFNAFESIIHQTYEPSSNNVFMDLAGRHEHHRGLPHLEISFGNPFHSHMENSFSNGSCATEVMNTLDRHAAFMNVGKHSDHITRKELENYLKREGRSLDPQDRSDLMEVLVNFDSIAAADGRSRGKGISSRDVDAVMLQEERKDRLYSVYGNIFESLHSKLRDMQDELASMRGEGSWNESRHRSGENRHQHGGRNSDGGGRNGDGGGRNGDGSGRNGDGGGRNGDGGGRDGDGGGRDGGGTRSGNPNDRVITEKQANGHFAIEGKDMPLSQEEFKRHYGIPQEVDLLKYMPGKANDGKVTPYWESGASGGLGGRKEDGKLKWDDPNYHTLKYDFSRNLAQVFQYCKGLPEDEAKEFAFNFARTQQAVFAANGFDLQKVDNEKVYSAGEGTEGWTDFVQDIGGKDSKIQW